MFRKRAWSRNFYSGTAQFDEEIRAGLASEWQAYEDLQYLVRPVCPHRYAVVELSYCFRSSSEMVLFAPYPETERMLCALRSSLRPRTGAAL